MFERTHANRAIASPNSHGAVPIAWKAISAASRPQYVDGDRMKRKNACLSTGCLVAAHTPPTDGYPEIRPIQKTYMSILEISVSIHILMNIFLYDQWDIVGLEGVAIRRVV
ncbi:hypothetical protein [Burkholderia mayonis]|uniref:hypothetical protein n=1 Tax=Burkholderia mayonis TaxID=1385591 RepID=UPI0013967D28|nr:hypothetical protein [Burkholderia mayonis]